MNVAHGHMDIRVPEQRGKCGQIDPSHHSARRVRVTEIVESECGLELGPAHGGIVRLAYASNRTLGIVKRREDEAAFGKGRASFQDPVDFITHRERATCGWRFPERVKNRSL